MIKKHFNSASQKFIFSLIITGLTVYVISLFFCQLYIIHGDSMYPTYKNNEPVLLWKFNFKKSLDHNDVIVIKADSVNSHVVKRIIGIPGDTVCISEGIVYVNGQAYSEAGSFPQIEDPGNASVPILLNENEFFVLGDNRNLSSDSRFDTIGIINITSITGIVFLPSR